MHGLAKGRRLNGRLESRASYSGVRMAVSAGINTYRNGGMEESHLENAKPKGS